MNVGATRIVIKRVCGVEWLVDSPSFYVLADNHEVYIELFKDEWGIHARLIIVELNLYRDFLTMEMAASWFAAYWITGTLSTMAERMLKGKAL
jgi:hypothetical protein